MVVSQARPGFRLTGGQVCHGENGDLINHRSQQEGADNDRDPGGPVQREPAGNASA
jgi:hypothetical protein